MQATLEIVRSHPRCRFGRLPAGPPEGPGRLARPGKPLGMTTSDSITLLLRQWRDGDGQALDRLVPQVYDELRGLARRELAPEDETGGGDGA